jgi:hypothetical protein
MDGDLKNSPEQGLDPAPAGAERRPARCVVLVPVAGFIEPGCERGLAGLEARGYAVRRVRGYADIDLGRSQMATDALADGFEELMWIDADIAFNPDDVDRLRSHGLPIVCGLYAKKGPRALACQTLPGTGRIDFGPDARPFEIRYAGFGFVLTHRRVYGSVRERQALPECDAGTGRTVVPYFMPLLQQEAGGPWYLAEDYAFCERARRSGWRVMADPAVRLWHIGTHRYSWEDAGSDRLRYGRYTFHINS